MKLSVIFVLKGVFLNEVVSKEVWILYTLMSNEDLWITVLKTSVYSTDLDSELQIARKSFKVLTPLLGKDRISQADTRWWKIILINMPIYMYLFRIDNLLKFTPKATYVTVEKY